MFDSDSSLNSGIISNFIFNKQSTFKNCTFKVNDIFKIYKDSFFYFDNCTFNNSVEFVSTKDSLEYSSTTIDKCEFKGYSSFGYLKLRYLKINDCIFSSYTKFSDMSIDDVQIKGCKFYMFFGMQSSHIDNVFHLLNSSFKDGCFLRNSILPKYGIQIYNLELSTISTDSTSFRATLVDNHHKYNLEQGMVKYSECNEKIMYKFDIEKIQSKN